MAQDGSKKNSPTPPTQGTNPLFLLAIGALVVVGLAAVAIIASSRSNDTSTDAASTDSATGETAADGAQTAAIAIGNEPLPTMPEGVQIADATNDPAWGLPAPTLTGTGFDGTEIVIEADGSAKAIYFVAHWCPHCQEEIPMIQGLIDAGKLPEGLDVYAVSTAVDQGRGNYPPSDWLAREGFTPTVIRDDDAASALEAFGATSFPFAVFLNEDNEVVARIAGSTSAETAEQAWQATLTAP